MRKSFNKGKKKSGDKIKLNKEKKYKSNVILNNTKEWMKIRDNILDFTLNSSYIFEVSESFNDIIVLIKKQIDYTKNVESGCMVVPQDRSEIVYKLVRFYCDFQIQNKIEFRRELPFVDGPNADDIYYDDHPISSFEEFKLKIQEIIS